MCNFMGILVKFRTTGFNYKKPTLLQAQLLMVFNFLMPYL